MAELYIVGFDGASTTAAGEPADFDKVTIGGTSAQSSALPQVGVLGRRIVRLFAEANCFVAWGLDPTAAEATGVPMGSENPEYFSIKAGDKIAVVTR